MEQPINCFKWQSYSSDYLDKTLPESLYEKINEHLKICTLCHDQLDHYQQIISCIAHQPKSTLPLGLKKPTRLGIFYKKEEGDLWLPRWRNLPWPFRTLLESSGIVILILGGVYSAPKLRDLYIHHIEKSSNDFDEASLASESVTEELDTKIPPLQKNKEPRTPATQKNNEESEDLVSGEDDSETEDQVQVGKSQLWRFTLKTVSPDELRPLVVKTLIDLGIPQTTPGLGGIQVPGGIEFDFILPQTRVAEIKHALSKLAPKASDPHSSASNENFTWYRVKSKKTLPKGTSQVVIWLSQLN